VGAYHASLYLYLAFIAVVSDTWTLFMMPLKKSSLHHLFAAVDAEDTFLQTSAAHVAYVFLVLKEFLAALE
jgi:hypothetical protein